ncbi:alpha/beta fold hydrolase [Limimaricola pyoseonensis]|uniref:Pimeloyl-ACP methyl ester carboxylesterase n=1 Tax=Limimaricola pyoseonensis TaxID=521013 RepID=A0A1G7CXY5_9RHOB|nr:alpha/beta hydrolase [Limimaricola pyoseonensis]SDE44304.1 Pimeloyl-ACP methyl ester carboxylesterase [Limimaricola pyoseonensis]
MPLVTTKDGTQLYVKDWGEGRPVVLIHGWPLNSDSWETVALRLAESGHRVIAYDRRGFGRSGQPYGGYDYDTLADDLGTVISELGLTDAAIAGFSMGGGEVARYMSRHDGRGVKQAALIASVAPGMLKSGHNPDGVTEDVFAGMRAGLRKDRPAFLQDFARTFYGNKVSDGVLQWTLMMAMQASPKATLDCVDAFGTTDFTEDVKGIDVPTLVIHGTGDEIVPIALSGRRAAKLAKQAELKEYEGRPHGLLATDGDRVADDLIAFLKG